MTTGSSGNGNLPPRAARTKNDRAGRGGGAEEPAAAAGSLVGLFAPPPTPPPRPASLAPSSQSSEEKGGAAAPNENTALLPPPPPMEEDDDDPSSSAHYVDEDDESTLSSPRQSRTSSSLLGGGGGAAITAGGADDNNNNNNGRRTSGLLANDFFQEFKALRQQGPQPKVQFANDDDDDDDDSNNKHSPAAVLRGWWHRWRRRRHPLVEGSLLAPTTVAGALMFLLYHVVFCLAFGSALMRPHAAAASGGGRQILGVTAKLSAVGIFGAGPVYIYRLNRDIPAVYPSVDLFLAPFLAQAAATVDDSLWEQHRGGSSSSNPDGDDGDGSYPDELFFGSFAVLASLGMALAGLFLYLGSTFKLANLGTYLPYSVLSGFFSAVGVLLWCLAFSVDASGRSWKAVFFSGDAALVGDACLHHAPSLAIGVLMNRLGPKNPFYVILLLVATQIIFYAVMAATGTTLEDAQRLQWFWSKDELVYRSSDDGNSNNNNEQVEDYPTTFADTESTTSSFGWSVPPWALPPSPLGSFGAVLAGNVNWIAVAAGIPNMAALAFLYLLRSSIHASAMKKNVGNLVRRIPIRKTSNPKDNNTSVNDYLDISQTTVTGNKNISTTSGPGDDPSRHRRQSSYISPTSILESVRNSVSIVQLSMQDRKPLFAGRQEGTDHHSTLATTTSLLESPSSPSSSQPQYVEIRAKAPRRSLESIFSEYSYALFVVAVVGGFGVCPTVATSNTMYAIGADAPAPQYGSILLLVAFYFMDFEVVKYIPKTAFSSLLVLGAVDTLTVWFFGAFHKTQDLAEWLVVPMIAAFSLFVGFLNAVFLGIGISMFVFVAAFFRVGVVKFNATGLEIRSRIERTMAQSMWLNDNGDLIQVMVLQNYLFFGNASSILSYITTMFEVVDETESQRLGFNIPPFPKILILDLSLVTGMDTSTADIFGEIFDFCKNNDCKLFLCGLSPRMKKALELGGVKPEGGPRSSSSVRFFSDLDTTLGRAEDSLIRTEMTETLGRRSRKKTPESRADGFRRALKQIDELHGVDFASGLLTLHTHMEFLELEPGQCLYECDGGVVEDSQRGLFFIEEGLLKIERDSGQSLTMTRTRGSIGAATALNTLKNQHARIGTVARRSALVKGIGAGQSSQNNLRLARLGPGWVCGTLDMASGHRRSGITSAVTQCRLHHLPFLRLEQIEKDDPALVLSLYKAMAYLMASSQEATIEQLSTLNSIMSSPAHSKPIGRAARGAMGP